MSHFHPSVFFDLDAFFHKSIFEDCSAVWETLPKIKPYLDKQRLGAIEIDIPKGVHIPDPKTVSIGKGSTIEPGAYIQGPCIIGDRCIIRHGAYIRGNVIAGNDCILGHSSEFKNTILLNEAHAAHFAYVGDTILGNRVNIGAGTICANLKLDRSSVGIFVNGSWIDTGLRKFGAIIGDGTQIGCNSVTNPGTLLGKDVLCYPCTNFGGVVPEGTTVKPETGVAFSEK
jgi:UDP-N-acetylglucosamine diphosphorylase / glucose-1-phosphate thymidylyltransferase / UDP-N-acetylgalactosamine diphosphorylase / glucosamine-1-phosphate N-acetyltransferase / galactosamine-1-phosphate N-acetyltransferase